MITVDDLTLSVPSFEEGSPRVLFPSISFSIKTGQKVGLIGKSGVGKTTLLNALSGFDGPNNSIRVHANADDLSYCMQHDTLIEQLSVDENIDFFRSKNKVYKLSKTDVLRMFAIDDVGKLYPSQLSGGMRRRANLAIAVSREPLLLFVDEAFANLDIQTKISAIKSMKSLWFWDRITFIAVAHDPIETLLLCNHVIHLDNNASIPIRLDPIDDDVTIFGASRKTVLDLEKLISKNK